MNITITRGGRVGVATAAVVEVVGKKLGSISRASTVRVLLGGADIVRNYQKSLCCADVQSPCTLYKAGFMVDLSQI